MSVYKGHCNFKEVKTPLTVGDTFIMHCRWPGELGLSTPFRWRFKSLKARALPGTPVKDRALPDAPVKDQALKYHLVVLKQLRVDKGEGVFRVSSYRVGPLCRSVGTAEVGGTGVEFSLPEWEVSSVIPAAQKADCKALSSLWPLGVTFTGLVLAGGGGGGDWFFGVCYFPIKKFF